MMSTDDAIVAAVERRVKAFYAEHPEIKPSHGWEDHVSVVHMHTQRALHSLLYSIPTSVRRNIELAALLHDVDDSKYFPEGSSENARSILVETFGTYGNDDLIDEIIEIISWVGCSKNGNSVPFKVKVSHAYHLLIPRWADRLEAVGRRGVVRCYQFNNETSRPLFTENTPRAKSEEDLWRIADPPGRLQKYMERGGTSESMIDHYYDKLLHIARPPREIVRNPYLEQMADSSAQPLVEVCLRFGRTGKVDESYIMSLL
ncbi:hypothetical protein THAOC_32262 [Thalassiosira oceanica]|uniref:HD/PDEase domain-containing protein n=1 Tax=Thalassiosira oceanica TaxID=159749 RepID=K0R7J2_THAOC|nr:hypothetical protein THAOC_32262 [Thalassiosira oceanica]|eukprot:EJK48905.1 hypothetical protein THAOC_32262 [Thalassiosira oceanica]